MLAASDTVIEKLKAFFNNSVAHKDKNFGNARFVFFEKQLLKITHSEFKTLSFKQTLVTYNMST